MESSQKAGLVKPSEWILLVCATALLTAAVTHQRTVTPHIPVEAKMDMPIDETVPATDTSAGISTEAEIVAVLVTPTRDPLADTTN